MWSLVAIGPLVLVVTLAAGADLDCPAHIRSAEDSIKKAGAMTLGPEAKALVEKAQNALREAKKNLADARAKIDYANCMWKARAPQAQAESAAAISTP